MSDTERWRPASRSRSRSRDRISYRDRRSRYRSRSRSRSRSRDRRTRDRRASPPHSRRRLSHSRSPPRRSSPPRRRSPPRHIQRIDEPPPVGAILQARVVSLRPFGAFIELPGCQRQGLVHSSQVAEELRFGRDEDDEMKVKALEFYCPRGETVWVKVLDVRHDGRDVKIGCSMRAVDQHDGTDLDPGNLLAAPGGGGGGGPGGGGRLSDAVPEIGTVHSAVVQSIRPFGAFVQMDGYRKYGLVHFTQISDHLSFSSGDSDAEKIVGISEVVAQGERVWVKVVDVTQDERGPKVGCSIKLVSQRDGTDLDPENVKYKPRGEGGGGGPGGGGFRGQMPIGAAAGEVRGDALDWGHLKADVVTYGSTKQYDILAAEEDDDVGGVRGAPQEEREPSGAGILPPRGRGRGNILPSWMTAGPGEAPGAPGSGAGSGPIRSVEDALAVLEAHGVKHRSKDKKHKKHKHKKEKKSKHKKEKRRSSGKGERHGKDKRSRSDSDSSSESRNPVCETKTTKTSCISTVDEDDRGHSMPNPRINSYPWGGGNLPLATSACTAGDTLDSSCTINLVPARNLANTPPFSTLDVYTEYFASKRELIEELDGFKGFGYLTPKQYLTMRYVLTLKPCALVPATTPPTGIADSVIFGSSPYYSGYAFDAPYVLLDYKSYVISNSTAASWTVEATKAVGAGARRTKLNVMLLPETEFQKWEQGCKDKVCQPPKASAVPGTYCNAYKCKGKVSGLAASLGNTTRLLVSWPWVTTYGSANKTSFTIPTVSPYDRELVKVKIVPTYAFNTTARNS